MMDRYEAAYEFLALARTVEANHEEDLTTEEIELLAQILQVLAPHVTLVQQ